MNGLSDKYKQIIGRIVESTIDSSQDLVDDVVCGEIEEEIENTLHDLYSDAVLDEIYSDIEDIESIGDRELNDVSCVIERAINGKYSKIKGMIQNSKMAPAKVPTGSKVL